MKALFKAVLFAIIGLALSCKEKKSIELNNVATHVFETKMGTRSKHSGVYLDENTNKRYLYFGNVATDRVIKFFDADTKALAYTIPLDSVVKRYGNIDDFSIVSPDTVIVLGQYNNHLFFLNQKGEIWKKLWLDSLVSMPENKYFEAFSSTYSEFIVSKNALLFQVNTGFIDKASQTALERSQNYNKNKWASPYFLKLDRIYDEKPKQFFAYSLYKDVFPDQIIADLNELGYYYIDKDRVYVFSVYANKLITLNAETLNKVREIEITSKNTPIGVDLLPINEQTIGDLESLSLDNLRTQGCINRVFYNSYKKHYYITALTEISPEFFNENRYRPRVLMIYDQNFEKLAEIPFQDNTYSSDIISTKAGLMLLKKKKTNSNGEQVVIYDEFTYE